MRYRIISFGRGWHVQVKRFGLFWTYELRERDPGPYERMTFETDEEASAWLIRRVAGQLQRSYR